MMIDMFSFPTDTGSNTDERIANIINYLIQFKETLEFALTNISVENLAPDLVNQLNELGANIEQSKTERENELAQISGKSSLTVFDVINSEAFKSGIKNGISNIKFDINFETGHLEYSMSE